MQYHNPIISGFYPDPSICRANEKYYLVCSSFQYFPGIPLFESTDLINWNLIGNVLTRESQLPLKGCDSHAGIYAPTIRYSNGRFYVVTTNVSHGGNFYVYTDNIYGEWSEPVYVEQDGIDPSLYFENGKAYFMSNGTADNGEAGIIQCEIDINTGQKLSPGICVWTGTGGRFLESPHLYKIGNYYYIMAAEGGTEYGHMIVYGRSLHLFGPFENYPHNPVLTNRNLGGYIIQGIGHGDLIEDGQGNFYIFHLGFRQIHQWIMHHITGREVYLSPVFFQENGWFTAGENGTCKTTMTAPIHTVQKVWQDYSFQNTSPQKEWVYLRNPDLTNYRFEKEQLSLRGCCFSLNETIHSPTFLGLRQKEMNGDITVSMSVPIEEAGLTLYMDHDQHYDLCLKRTDSGLIACKHICLGTLSVDETVPLPETDAVLLHIACTNEFYEFDVQANGKIFYLGKTETKFLSSETSGNFTGVIIGLYACHSGETTEWTTFQNFHYKNLERQESAS